MVEGTLERGGRRGWVSSGEGPPELEGTEGPRVAGAGGEDGEFVDPGGGLGGVAGADGCLQAVDGGQAVQGWDPHVGQVVQRSWRVALGGGSGTFGPSRDVVGWAGHDAQRVSGGGVFEGSEVVVEVVAAGQGCEQG